MCRLVKVSESCGELCPQNWRMMDVAGSDINNRGITRQTHGPLSDNCHIWDQFSTQNTTVTQLSITKAAPVRKYLKNIFIIYRMNIHDVSSPNTIFILTFQIY